ncbi:LysR family transcriptional regulator [Mycobacterium yunnanensis]|uniref:LysR family transcriptional regulator n=1 Tax=Mycobacterium yunnanensis TaxID=368477 RepID=A0A9X2Z7K0_9MYCO|nr:LysR family transcriptional regulator [Mycobacterium yunnanensis]MCV7423766.1 LysR family transcriptional regulator [Mycobacterium yunnanensis]
MRILAAVANTGRLTKAANALGVDHSTISRRLNALEKALGGRLVERGPDGWDLTPRGRSIVQHARAIQAAVEFAVRTTVESPPGSLDGTVRVVAPDAFGALFVTPALMRIREQHPALEVELVTGARYLTLRNIGFDLAFTVGKRPHTTLVTEHLCDYDCGFYASDSYVLKHGDPATLSELRRHPLVYFIESLQTVDEINLQDYVEDAPPIGFASTNIFALLEATRHGAGIGLIPRFVAATVPEIRPVGPPLRPRRVAVTLAARKDAFARPDVLAIRDAVRDEVRIRGDELVGRQ